MLVPVYGSAYRHHYMNYGLNYLSQKARIPNRRHKFQNHEGNYPSRRRL